MPDDRIKISEFSTPVSLNNDDVIVIVQNVGGVKTTYKAPLTLLATQLLKNMQFASDLETTNKAIIGAINEVAQGGGGASSLVDLTDVTITNPSNGQVITYNAQTGKWVNGAGTEIKFTSTVSGAIASCGDGAEELPVNSWKVSLTHKQASGTPTPSSPLPISGTNTVNVYQTGINQWDEEWELGNIDMSTGENTPSNVNIRSKNYIPCKPETSYYAAIPSSISLCFYTSEKTYIDDLTVDNSSVITTPANCCFMRFVLYNETTYSNNLGINHPASETMYHAYNEKIAKTINLQSTVYDGEFDVINGEADITQAAYTFDGDETWQRINATTGVWRSEIVQDAKFAENVSIISDRFQGQVSTNNTEATSSTYPNDSIWIGSTLTSKYVFIKNSSFTSKSLVKSATNGAKIVYPLANPTHSTVATPEPTTTLKGVNNFLADCGNSEVEYFNSLAGDVANLVNFLTPHDASELDYDNTSSDLAADDVQSAIDEVAESLGIMNTATLLWTGDMHGNGAQATIPNLSDWLIVGYSVDENEDFYISIGTAGRGGSNYVQYQGSNVQFIAHRFDVNGNTISATQADQGISFSGGTTYNDSASCHVRKVYGLLKKPTINS